MKKILSIALAAVVALGFTACNDKGKGGDSALNDSISTAFGELYGSGMGQQLKQDSTIKMDDVMKGIKVILKSDTSDHAFMAGIQIGMQIQQMMGGVKQQYGVDINEKAFMDSFMKALKKDSVNQEEMMALQQSIEPMLKRAKEAKAASDPVAINNKKKGAEFIAKKAKEGGYTKTKSGIVYKVLAQGSGANFTDKDVVEVKYVGKLIDGKEFDSSNGEAAAFPVTGVVPGFSEMLKLMKPGMKVEVIIPGELAYGVDGREPKIGPNETLVFELEAIGVKKMDAKGGNQVPVEVAPTEMK
ncbi:MAG: FKBP-type peptidyl-prolyl cis-trans isomerase [Muribaculaceae bacterium]|nr:FKBP-type peptidyl-prolyl cis-trans isomerase [Muribaculaceae bacterium]